METLSALLVDFLSAYKVDVEVVDYIKNTDHINFYVIPLKKTKVRDIVNIRNDLSVHFAPCPSIVPIFEKGVIRITIYDPD